MAKPTKTEVKTEQKPEQDTTIKVSPELKRELEELKADPDESFANVIRRLKGKTAPADGDMVTLSLPKKAYLMLLMIVPENLKDTIRRGIR